MAQVQFKKRRHAVAVEPEKKKTGAPYADISRIPVWGNVHGSPLQRSKKRNSGTARTGAVEAEDSGETVCPENLGTAISSIESGAWGMLDSVIAHMETYDGVEPAVTKQMLEKYFKRSSKLFSRRIVRKLRRVRKRSEKTRYRCVAAPNKPCDEEGDRAVAAPCLGGLVPVDLCAPTFFNDVPLDQEKTFIHEWFHQYGCKGDVAYDYEEEFGELSTSQSLFNADSYAEFVGGYYLAI